MKRCPYKTSLNKNYESCLKEEAFNYMFIPEKKEGKFVMSSLDVSSIISNTFLDVLEKKTSLSYSEQVVLLTKVLNEVLKRTSSEELFNRFLVTSNTFYSTAEEARLDYRQLKEDITREYFLSLYPLGIKRRKDIILSSIYSVCAEHLSNTLTESSYV